uniref:Uncharacterized protein n=1 Tax=Timema monikensis TaxID=170555 RepID=A0A7R9DWS5_9NEOP|nr:unnamed protein product [Timema monikensis]
MSIVLDVLPFHPKAKRHRHEKHYGEEENVPNLRTWSDWTVDGILNLWIRDFRRHDNAHYFSLAYTRDTGLDQAQRQIESVEIFFLVVNERRDAMFPKERTLETSVPCVKVFMDMLVLIIGVLTLICDAGSDDSSDFQKQRWWCSVTGFHPVVAEDNKTLPNPRPTGGVRRPDNNADYKATVSNQRLHIPNSQQGVVQFPTQEEGGGGASGGFMDCRIEGEREKVQIFIPVKLVITVINSKGDIDIAIEPLDLVGGRAGSDDVREVLKSGDKLIRSIRQGNNLAFAWRESGN